MKTDIDLEKRGHGKIVLIADDNPTLRKAVAAAFLSAGFKTSADAENGKEAIEAAKQIKPDVIILDLSMPVMNGLEAASQLRKIFPAVPIIIFTMYGDSFRRDVSSTGVSLVFDKTEPLQNLIEKTYELMGH